MRCLFYVLNSGGEELKQDIRIWEKCIGDIFHMYNSD